MRLNVAILPVVTKDLPISSLILLYVNLRSSILKQQMKARTDVLYICSAYISYYSPTLRKPLYNQVRRTTSELDTQHVSST